MNIDFVEKQIQSLLKDVVGTFPGNAVQSQRQITHPADDRLHSLGQQIEGNDIAIKTHFDFQKRLSPEPQLNLGLADLTEKVCNPPQVRLWSIAPSLVRISQGQGVLGAVIRNPLQQYFRSN